MANSWQKAFSRIFWRNRDKGAPYTPLGESKLLPMDASINEMDDRILVLNTTKADQSDLLTAFKSVSFNSATGVFTFTKFNNTKVTVNTDIEKIAINFDYDDDPTSAHYQNLIITLEDGTIKYVDMSALLTQYEFTDSTTIHFTVTNGIVSANVINGSITSDHLSPELNAKINNAEYYSEDSEAWAVGQKNGQDVPSTDPHYHNNSKYYAEQAEASLSKIDGITVANASGESFALVPTSEGNALATHIYGMSVQDGTPTPSSPVDIASSKADFRCVGKNINSYPYYQTTRTVGGITWTDNGDGTVTANGTATDNSALICHSRGATSINKLIIPNGTYILSGCPNGGVSNTYYINAIVTQNGSAVSLGQDFGEGVEITINGDDNYTDRAQLQIACNIRTNYTASNLTFKPMLTLKGTDQTYEPHKHTDIITDLTLRAIEVTSSDNYNLVRDGKYYIADTVDWSEDGGYVLTRRVGVHTFDENSTGSLSGHNTADTIYNFAFPLASNDMSNASWITPNDNVFKYCLLDHFQYEGITQANATRAGFFGNTQALYLRMEKATASVWSDMQTWLASNNTEVIYSIVPTTETLTSEQVQSLLSLKTYDVSTSINAQASPEPTVELEYAKSQTTAMALSGHNEALIAQELEGLYGAKNLIPYPYIHTTKTENGITFVDNGDGTVTVSGTASAYARFQCHKRINTEPNEFWLKNGEYELSGCPNGGATNTYYIKAHRTYNGANSDLAKDTGNGATVKLNGDDYGSDGVYLGIIIEVLSGTVISSPITFKPMLRLATNTSNTYQPYAMTNYELTQKIRELETAIIELGGN